MFGWLRIDSDVDWFCTVGGWPTPLKNDGVRQLGWLIVPNMWKNNPNVPSHQPDWFCRSCGFPNGMTSLDVPMLGAVLSKQHTASGVIFFWRSLNRDLSEVKIAQHHPKNKNKNNNHNNNNHNHNHNQHKQEPGQKLVTLPIIYVSRDRRHTLLMQFMLQFITFFLTQRNSPSANQQRFSPKEQANGPAMLRCHQCSGVDLQINALGVLKQRKRKP